MQQGKVLVGTFHKTGSKLMESVFQTIGRRLGLSVWRMQRPEPKEWRIGIHTHSKFSNHVLQQPHRGVIVIRDPRDVVISAAYYHCKSSEAWLHIPQERFGGLTYQQKIQSLPDNDARFVFEMDHAAGRVINNMQKAKKTLQEFKFVRFEDLVTDFDLKTFEDMFRFLGFPEEQLTKLKKIAHNRSLFGDKMQNKEHVRSGATEQWKREFSPALLREFAARHEPAVERLGYEPSPEPGAGGLEKRSEPLAAV